MHTVTSKDGTRIAYDQTGQGPALILVGGAFSHRKFQGMVQLASLLSESFTVYNYDRRGRGDSGDNRQYAIEREIEDIRALIDAAGGSAFVWGLSSGAVLALEAARSGAPISMLALHEPPFIVDERDRKAPDHFVDRLRDLIENNRRSAAVRYFMTQGMGVPSFVVVLMRLMPSVWSNLTALAHTTLYDAIMLEGYSAGKPLPAERWSEVRMQTLVLEGPESPLSLRRGSQALAKVLPNSKLVSKKGLGHTKQLHAKMISSELAAFFTHSD